LFVVVTRSEVPKKTKPKKIIVTIKKNNNECSTLS
jgi:hypothetical protein